MCCQVWVALRVSSLLVVAVSTVASTTIMNSCGDAHYKRQIHIKNQPILNPLVIYWAFTRSLDLSTPTWQGKPVSTIHAEVFSAHAYHLLHGLSYCKGFLDMRQHNFDCS